MEDDRGRIEDGPWALLLAALARSGRTGQLTVRAPGNKVYALALARGVIVGATSPMAVDSVARIASSLLLPAAGPRERRAAKLVDRNADPELDAYVAGTQLAPVQLDRLKHRMLVQRAARTFALERGTYALESRVVIPVMRDAEVDVRAVVFTGALLHLDAGRIAAEFSGGGTRFALAARAELARFELDEADQPILEALRRGASVAEVEATHREIDPRRIQAVFYALATCGALVVAPPRTRTHARGSVDLERRITPQGVRWMRLPTNRDEPAERSSDQCIPMLIRKDAEVAVHHAVGYDTERVKTTKIRSYTEPGFEARPTRLRPNALGASELVTLISTRSAAVERGADHFALLGVAVGASVEEVRAAYLEAARNLRTERLAELRIRDVEFRARGLLAQICIAYTVLTDPVRRADYIAGLRRSAAPSAAAIDFNQLARDAFDRGARALRSDDPVLAVIELRTACELAPDDIRYLATLGHAEFCAAAAVAVART